MRIFGFDFSYAYILRLKKKKVLDWPIMGEVGLFRVVLKVGVNESYFQPRQKFVVFKSYMNPLYLQK